MKWASVRGSCGVDSRPGGAGPGFRVGKQRGGVHVCPITAPEVFGQGNLHVHFLISSFRHLRVQLIRHFDQLGIAEMQELHKNFGILVCKSSLRQLQVGLYFRGCVLDIS